MTTESKDPPAFLSILFLLMGVGIIGGAGYMYLQNPDGALLSALGIGAIGGFFSLLAIKALRSSDTYETVSREDI